MKDNQTIRDEVAESYTRAVKSGQGCGCGCAAPKPKGAAAALAGYSDEELGSLPRDAVESSFGCGNPVAFAEVREGETVVDLGSGAGIDLLIAAKKVGPTGKVIGVDMTDEMIARARAIAAAAGATQVEVRKGIIEDLPVEDASVDWLISNCVINLSPEKDRVFAEIARVLRPGGQISVSDIVVQDLPDGVRESTTLYSACVSGAVSEEEYLAGLRAAGLVDVRVEERLVYEPSQVMAFLSSEELGELSKALTPELIRELPSMLQGKVWSAKFRATKPE